jgi:thioredoxin-related protein
LRTASYSLASAQAKREGKLLFIEFGREQCSQCRALVQNVIPRAEVAAVLKSHFVALASDCDDAEPEVEALALQLSEATMLPFVMVADADGRFLHGSSGAVDAQALLRTLERLVTSRSNGQH